MICYLLIISIVVSIPCIVIAAIQLNGDEYLQYLKEKSLNSFISKLTIATIIKVIETNKEKDYLTYVIIGLNMLGIFFLLIVSIFLFRSIIRTKLKFDKTQNTPSDYAILMRNIPRECSE